MKIRAGGRSISRVAKSFRLQWQRNRTGSQIHQGDAAFKAEIISDNIREKLLTDGVFIVAKTAAKYTDSARRANIQGHVLVKVELQANGAIGIVTAVNELSDGLTEQAIAAARKIVFLPKRTGGIPVTVIQTFDYTFSIY